jgi:hypothetical protein
MWYDQRLLHMYAFWSLTESLKRPLHLANKLIAASSPYIHPIPCHNHLCHNHPHLHKASLVSQSWHDFTPGLTYVAISHVYTLMTDDWLQLLNNMLHSLPIAWPFSASLPIRSSPIVFFPYYCCPTTILSPYSLGLSREGCRCQRCATAEARHVPNAPRTSQVSGWMCSKHSHQRGRRPRALRQLGREISEVVGRRGCYNICST